MICSKCGEICHEPNAKFCHICGKRLKKSKKTSVALTILGVIASICVIIWLYNRSHSSIAKTISYNELSIDNAIEAIVCDSAKEITVWNNDSILHKVAEKNLSDTATQITFALDEDNTTKVIVENVYNTLKIYRESRIKKPNLKVILPYNADLATINLSDASTFRSDYGMKGEQVDVNISKSSNFYCNIEASTASIGLSYESNLIGNVDAAIADIKMSEQSKIKGKIQADTLKLIMNGASCTDLAGNVKKLVIDLRGASKIKEKLIKNVDGERYAFACEKCLGKMSSGSVAYIHCFNEVEIGFDDATLYYTGDCIDKNYSFERKWEKKEGDISNDCYLIYKIFGNKNYPLDIKGTIYHRITPEKPD